MKLPINYHEADWRKRKEVRKEYIKVQNNLCHHCKQPLDSNPDKNVLALKVNKKLFPKNFFKWPIHLHHDHNTGMTIGAVHCHCNAVLWQYYGE